MRLFLSHKFDPLNKKDACLALTTLLNLTPQDCESARAWFGLFHEVSCALSEAKSILELNTACDFRNKTHEKKLKKFEDDILVQVAAARSQLMDTYLNSPFQHCMHEDNHGRISQDLNLRKKLSNATVSQLKQKETQILRLYKELTQNAQAVWNGKVTPISVISGKFSDPNPKIREQAFESYWGFIEKNEETYQNLFEDLLQNRKRQAQACGFQSYADFAFCELGRVDYGVQECAQFRQSISNKVTPLLSFFAQEQKRSLGTKTLLPWDAHIWPGMMPSKDPACGNWDLLMPCVQKIMGKIHPSFESVFQEMVRNDLFDVRSRHGKAPGAFCTTLHETKRAFLFANLNATFKDSLTLIHEFGHSLHAYSFTQINNILVRQPGLEFCELASIGLELLSNRYFNELWKDPRDQHLAVCYQLFNMLSFWPFMAMIDEWQHMVYSSAETPTAKERNKLWKDLSRKYRPHWDWSSCGKWEELGWVSRPHIFTSPFYYIDYGIAQMGALQLWISSKKNYSAAVEKYVGGLRLGGQQPLPELFSSCGLKFDFGEELLGQLCDEILQSMSLDPAVKPRDDRTKSTFKHFH